MRKNLLVLFLLICLLLSGCTADQESPAVAAVSQTENESQPELLFSDREKLNADGYLLWLQVEEKELEDGYDNSLYFCTYDFREHQLMKREIDCENIVYLIRSNYPEGAVVVEESADETFAFWSVSKDKGFKKEQTVRIANGSEIRALYDGNLYYRDRNAHYNVKSLKNGKHAAYDEHVFDDIAVSLKGDLIFEGITVVEYESNGQYYPETICELGLAKPGKAWQKISLPENCLLESGWDVRGIWIDDQKALLALRIKTDEKVENTAYLYSAETNQLSAYRTQNGDGIVLCEGKNNLKYDGITASPDGKYIAYIVYNIGGTPSEDKPFSLGKGGEDQAFIIIASLETGEKYLISDPDFAEGSSFEACAPLLWRN